MYLFYFGVDKSGQNIPEYEKRNPPSAGYDLIAGLGYYKIHKESKTWYESEKICMQEGAHLYVFRTKQETEAVQALFEKNHITKAPYWIGVHDQFKEGNYVTIFSKYLLNNKKIKSN